MEHSEDLDDVTEDDVPNDSITMQKLLEFRVSKSIQPAYPAMERLNMLMTQQADAPNAICSNQ